MKTRDALKTHRKKVHKVKTGLPSKAELELAAEAAGAALGDPLHITVTRGLGNEHVVAGIENVDSVDVGDAEDYSLSGLKTPASEIPVKDEVIISQFQIIPPM